MDFGPYSLLMDFGLMSILLFVAQLIRSKVKIVQNLYLPSALVAGFMGLMLGDQFLGIIPFSSKLSSYPYMLIVVLFASLFIGREEMESFKKVIDEVGDTFSLNLAAEIGGFGSALLLGGLIITHFFPSVPKAFPLLQPAGFVGGHGYAAAIGGSLQNLMGWEEALTIGQTFATIGILSSVLLGLLLINIATRIDATRFISTMSDLPESMRTGLVSEDKERNSLGEETVNPMSIDPLAWHALLILIATAGGYYGYHAFDALPFSVTLPMMCISMLAGVALHFFLKAIGMGEYVDRDIITRLGSTSTDYLVAFGIASIKISIVVKYLVPIIIMCVIGLGFNTLFLFFAGRKLFHNFWFERSIFVYGWTSGTVSIGVTLLRVVDPQFDSGALTDYGMAYVFISFIELGLVALTPVYVANGSPVVVGSILMVACFALLALTAIKYGVRSEGVDEFRPGEEEVINSSDGVEQVS